MKLNTKFWLRFSLVNLAIVAMLGVLLRYKIAFEFPYFDQKNIHHAHSHFAFVGWIAHSLFVLIINFLESQNTKLDTIKYKPLIILNLISAYFLLISFFTFGYSYLSLIFTLVSIVTAIIFMKFIYRDLKAIKMYNSSIAWLKASLWFNLIAYAGTLFITFMLLSKNFNDRWYLLAEYFYLHFQYNGFFVFACIGLALSSINYKGNNFSNSPLFLRLSLATVIPTYFLSTLWANIPLWLYIIVVIASLIQLVIWVKFIKETKENFYAANFKKDIQFYLYIFVIVAYSVKLLLQLGSTIPIISKLAFGFRPVVIAYLHLILLAVVSTFLILHFLKSKLIQDNKMAIMGILLFMSGVFFNEVVLAIQGIAAFSYTSIPNINYILFGIALLILTGVYAMILSQKKKINLT